jgi:hypothetical protein
VVNYTFLTFLILGLSGSGIVGYASEEPNHPKALNWASGVWELVPSNESAPKRSERVFHCGVDPLTINIDGKVRRYTSKFETEDSARGASITNATRSTITIKYDEEARIMENGKPHIWHMVFTSQDEFVWVRDDWIIDGEIRGSTQPRRRCVTNMV